MSVPHPKGGDIVWTCVNNHIINEKERKKSIGICGFNFKLLKEEESVGNREGLDG